MQSSSFAGKERTRTAVRLKPHGCNALKHKGNDEIRVIIQIGCIKRPQGFLTFFRFGYIFKKNIYETMSKAIVMLILVSFMSMETNCHEQILRVRLTTVLYFGQQHFIVAF